MSAYLVSPDTIDLIVSAAQRFQARHGSRFYADLSARDLPASDTDGVRRDSLSPHTDAEVMALLLWDENVHSVNVRYEYDTNRAQPVYTFRHVDMDHAAAAIDPAILALGSIRCLRYQSCEADDYSDTNACKLLNWIESLCVSHLISVAESPWGWTRDWTATRRAEIKARLAAQS